MKKSLLFILLLFPFTVKAMATSETFNLGDDIAVNIKGDGKGESFHVIKASAAGEETVWALYDGTLGISVYDQEIPGEHEATTQLEATGQNIYGKLTTASAGWKAETVRLLNQNDLSSLGITTSIPAKYSWMVPTKIEGENQLLTDGYNYWTMIAANDSTASDPKVLVVTLDELATSDSEYLATLQSVSIADVQTPQNAIRPVIEVKKEYILCNNSKTPDVVPTGLENYYIPFIVLSVIAIGGAIIINKKGSLKQI